MIYSALVPSRNRALRAVSVSLFMAAICAAGPASPSFEVASVKRAATSHQGGPVLRGGPGTDDPGHIEYRNVDLMTLLVQATKLYPFQISAPAKIGSETYDISAVAPPGTTKDQFRLMLMNLLEQRFGLAFHYERREVSCYELTIGKYGSKLVEAGASASRPPARNNEDEFPRLDHDGVTMRMAMLPGARRPSIFITARAQSVADLVHMIGEQLGCPVSDKTGLGASYDYKLMFVPEMGGSPLATAAGPDTEPGDSGPGIVAAVEKQLGLKLARARVASDTMVIDKVNSNPGEN